MKHARPGALILVTSLLLASMAHGAFAADPILFSIPCEQKQGEVASFSQGGMFKTLVQKTSERWGAEASEDPAQKLAQLKTSKKPDPRALLAAMDALLAKAKSPKEILEILDLGLASSREPFVDPHPGSLDNAGIDYRKEVTDPLWIKYMGRFFQMKPDPSQIKQAWERITPYSVAEAEFDAYPKSSANPN